MDASRGRRKVMFLENFRGIIVTRDPPSCCWLWVVMGGKVVDGRGSLGM